MPRKVRSDKKMSEVKYKGSIPPQPELTKGRFEALLTKSAQPLKPDLKGTRNRLLIFPMIIPIDVRIKIRL